MLVTPRNRLKKMYRMKKAWWKIQTIYIRSLHKIDTYITVLSASQIYLSKR